jgi:hypothetical protein
MTGFGTGSVQYLGSTSNHGNHYHSYHCSYHERKCLHERYYVVKDTLRYVTGSVNLNFDLCTSFLL